MLSLFRTWICKKAPLFFLKGSHFLLRGIKKCIHTFLCWSLKISPFLLWPHHFFIRFKKKSFLAKGAGPIEVTEGAKWGFSIKSGSPFLKNYNKKRRCTHLFFPPSPASSKSVATELLRSPTSAFFAPFSLKKGQKKKRPLSSVLFHLARCACTDNIDRSDHKSMISGSFRGAPLIKDLRGAIELHSNFSLVLPFEYCSPTLHIFLKRERVTIRSYYGVSPSGVYYCLCVISSINSILYMKEKMDKIFQKKFVTQRNRHQKRDPSSSTQLPLSTPNKNYRGKGKNVAPLFLPLAPLSLCLIKIVEIKGVSEQKKIAFKQTRGEVYFKRRLKSDVNHIDLKTVINNSLLTHQKSFPGIHFLDFHFQQRFFNNINRINDKGTIPHFKNKKNLSLEKGAGPFLASPLQMSNQREQRKAPFYVRVPPQLIRIQRPLYFTNLAQSDVTYDIIPSLSNVRDHIEQIRQTIKKNKGRSQVFLIKKLAPIIKGWSDAFYYRSRLGLKHFLLTEGGLTKPFLDYSYLQKKLFIRRNVINTPAWLKYAYYCDFLTFKMLWRWACRRHQKKSKIWIKEKYFKTLPFLEGVNFNSFLCLSNYASKYKISPSYAKKWVFAVQQNNRHQNGALRLLCLPTHSGAVVIQ
jgi:hypothetical protein